MFENINDGSSIRSMLCASQLLEDPFGNDSSTVRGDISRCKGTRLRTSGQKWSTRHAGTLAVVSLLRVLEKPRPSKFHDIHPPGHQKGARASLTGARSP